MHTIFMPVLFRNKTRKVPFVKNSRLDPLKKIIGSWVESEVFFSRIFTVAFHAYFRLG